MARVKMSQVITGAVSGLVAAAIFLIFYSQSMAQAPQNVGGQSDGLQAQNPAVGKTDTAQSPNNWDFSTDNGDTKDPLSQIAAEHTGRKSHKWSHYIPLYHRHFARFRGRKVHIMEIGVYGGGSLQLWKKYFGPQATIYGVDINPNIKSYVEDQIQVFVGDQADRAFLKDLRSKVPKLDILIDDGGHSMKQQKATYEELFDHVRQDGGVYWCEDMHTSYWADYQGGYRKPDSHIELSKTWIDSLNAHHSRGREKPAKTAAYAEKPSSFTEHVRGIYFYDSIVVVEKQAKRDVRIVTLG